MATNNLNFKVKNGVNIGSNLIFDGTAARIQGDFSSSISNRVLFQTNVTNGNTSLGLLSNGTATTSQVAIFNTSDANNSVVAGLNSQADVVALVSSKTGTASYVPLTFWSSGAERVRIDTSGNVGINTTPMGGLGNLQLASGYAATDTTARSLAFFSSSDAYVPGSNPSGLYISMTGHATATSRTVDISSVTYGSGSKGNLSLNNALTINTNGNVGIGASPLSRLWVGTNTGLEAIGINGGATGTGAGSHFMLYNGGTIIGGLGNHSAVFGGSYSNVIDLHGYYGLDFYTVGAKQMTLNTSGNLLIGTSTLNYGKFVVHATTDQNLIYSVNTNGLTTGEGGLVSLNDANTGYAPLNIAASSIRFIINSGDTLRITSSNNLSLAGPLSTTSLTGVIENNTGIVTRYNGAFISNNLTYNSGWKYLANGYGSYIRFDSSTSTGNITLNIAPNNTSGAGATASPLNVVSLNTNGSVYIGNTTDTGSGERFQVKNGVLGGTAGNTSINTAFYTPDTSNTSRLLISSFRSAAGTTHTTLRHLIQRRVDATDMGYIGFDSTGSSMGWGTTEHLRLDSSGNLAIGGTTAYSKLDVYGGTTVRGPLQITSSTGAAVSLSSTDNSYTGYSVANSQSQAAFTVNGAQAEIRTINAVPLAFMTNNLTRGYIDSVGNLTFGSTTTSGNRFLDIANTDSTTGGPNPGVVIRLITKNAAISSDISADIVKYRSGPLYINNNEPSSTGSIVFSTGGLGNVIIANTGNVGIGYGSGTGSRLNTHTSSNIVSCYNYNSLTSGFTTQMIRNDSAMAAGTGWAHFYGLSSNGAVGNVVIYGNGNIANTNNSYGSISDIKVKENIVDATPKLDDLMQVRIVNYNLKTDTPDKKQIGVIAQELETIFPGMIENTPDRDIDGNPNGETTKEVKYSVFVPMLIKAMQELKAEVDTLKAEIAVLKSQ